MPTINDLIQAYQNGSLSRDAYWSALREIHLTLFDYTQLLAEDSDLDHIAIHSGELRVVLKNGLQMVWEPKEIRTAPTMLVNYGKYEAAEHDTIQQIVKGCNVIVDIGANIGWYSLHIAHWQTEAQIYAFEPIPTTHAQLQRNITLNGLGDRTHLFQLALGESQDTVKFHIPRFMGSVAASRQPLYTDDENLTVETQMTRFDDWVKAQAITTIDFIKCDVEGAELFFLRGAVESIRTHRPIIMLEMLRKWAKAFGYHPNDIIAFMHKLDYKCYFQEDGQFHHLSDMDDSCTHTNFFFFHSTYDRLDPAL